MNIERIAFPAMIVAAVASIYLVFRGGSNSQAPAAVATVPVSTLPTFLNYQNPVLKGYLPPARYNPPGRDISVPYSGLRYPANFTAADALGLTPDGKAALSLDSSCGCGCG